jgi:EAL domain-containing protein (putative c-di-GMP-specific phosphodiesterase class I)
LLTPERFVPVAEECGLIDDLGAWVLQRACRKAAAWRDAGVRIVPLSVNVSPRQLQGQELVSRLRAVLEQTRLDPAVLMLELTESAMVRDFERVTEVLREIRALGIGISIDDFGTGYSSLSLLRRLPPQQIKIDRSFIGSVAEDPNDAAITRAVIAMARGMRIGVVAEGVETEAQFDFLRRHGCDAAQGYFISLPLDETAFLDLLRTSGAASSACPIG